MASVKTPVSDVHATRATLVVRGHHVLPDEILAAFARVQPAVVFGLQEQKMDTQHACLVSRVGRGAD